MLVVEVVVALVKKVVRVEQLRKSLKTLDGRTRGCDLAV